MRKTKRTSGWIAITAQYNKDKQIKQAKMRKWPHGKNKFKDDAFNN